MKWDLVIPIPYSPTQTGSLSVQGAGGAMNILVERLWLGAVSVSTTPPGQEPMPVVAAYQLLWKRSAYAVVEVLRTGRAGGGAYETLLPLNRESRVCVTVQPAAVLPSYSLWSRLGGGRLE